MSKRPSKTLHPSNPRRHKTARERQKARSRQRMSPEADIKALATVEAVFGVDLPPQQATFVLEYLTDFNATAASIRAGYSAKTAEVQGPRLLGNVRVAEAIGKGLQQQLRRPANEATRTIEELHRIAFSDIRQCFDAKGDILPVDQWPDEFAAAVASFERKPDGTVKLRIWDKVTALSVLAKIQRLAQDTIVNQTNLYFADRPDVRFMTNDQVLAELVEIKDQIDEKLAEYSRKALPVVTVAK